MTDRELLELAAKAVGYEIRWNDWRDYVRAIEAAHGIKGD